MAINKQTKISYQDVGAIDPEDKAPRHTTYNLRTFSNVDDAKNFYYTTNDLNAETVNFLSGRGNVELKIKESDDHLF